MKITGIVAEYNPFHNGHKYQIDFAKKHSDAVIIVMSGSFVQRGEAAVFDKWTRAKAALLGGADLVLELPVCFSVNSAERFAFGAVSLLNQLGIVDTLCFGSESGDLAQLKNAAHLLIHEPADISEKIRQAMQSGVGYPAARQNAYKEFIPKEFLRLPNNILALEYLCALEKLQSPIQPLTHRRETAGHHDTQPTGKFASAKAIRSQIAAQKSYSAFVPAPVWPVYENAVRYDTAGLDTALSYCLRSSSSETLRKISGVAEGLENRLIAAGRQHTSLHSIVKAVNTKRYTDARIRRICISSLLSLTPDLAKTPPKYARVLGLSAAGRAILAGIRKTASVQIINKAADYTPQDPMFAKDVLATDLAALCAADPAARQAGKDYTTSPVIL